MTFSILIPCKEAKKGKEGKRKNLWQATMAAGHSMLRLDATTKKGSNMENSSYSKKLA